MLPSELSRYWFGQALQEIRLDPGHFASHTVHKARLFFNEYEVPDNQDYQFFEQHVSRLLALPLPYGAVRWRCAAPSSRGETGEPGS